MQYRLKIFLIRWWIKFIAFHSPMQLHSIAHVLSAHAWMRNDRLQAGIGSLNTFKCHSEMASKSTVNNWIRCLQATRAHAPLSDNIRRQMAPRISTFAPSECWRPVWFLEKCTYQWTLKDDKPNGRGFQHILNIISTTSLVKRVSRVKTQDVGTPANEVNAICWACWNHADIALAIYSVRKENYSTMGQTYHYNVTVVMY